MIFSKPKANSNTVNGTIQNIYSATYSDKGNVMVITIRTTANQTVHYLSSVYTNETFPNFEQAFVRELVDTLLDVDYKNVEVLNNVKNCKKACKILKGKVFTFYKEQGQGRIYGISSDENKVFNNEDFVKQYKKMYNNFFELSI